MRLGIAMNPPHTCPEEWADKLSELGLGAAVFPCSEQAPDSLIDAYVRAACSHHIVIAEVGAWCNPLSADPVARKNNMDLCKSRLALADYVHARCCVNIAGTDGSSQWDGPNKTNFGETAMERVAESICEILDAVKPEHTFYTLEPMPWMIPASPEQYMELIRRTARPRFAVHMDIVNMISSPEKYFFNRAFMENAFFLLKGRIRACHVKDVVIGTKLTLHLSETMCGDGALDIRRYAELAEAEDPDMPFIIEHQTEWNAYLESIERVRRITAQESPLPPFRDRGEMTEQVKVKRNSAE